jgi:hypothetical protein
MKIIPLIDLTAPGVVMGRHAAWVPEFGLKVPFQWGGSITKYGKGEPSFPAADSLPHEVRILRALAERGMAPPVGDLVFIETLISRHPGGWHADPCGAWAYEMADATTLPEGRFSVEALRALGIEGSDGAWGDLGKPGNVVNGYLVDVRRSAWDLLRWPLLGRLELPPRPDDPTLVADLHCLGQFPPGERERCYQDAYIAPLWVEGERRVVERAALLGFTPMPGDTVLEIGCQTGGFLQLASLMTGGAATALGVEVNPDYIELGRRVARANRQNICIRQLDAVTERETLLAWVAERCPAGVDHLLVLSMEKHLGEAALWGLVDAIGARITYLETNAVSEARPWKLRPEVEARGGHHVGDSTDRNLRRLYRIERSMP